MPEPRLSRPPAFRPRVTLGLFYLAAFFLLYCMLLVAPELQPLLERVPVEQAPLKQQAAFEAARRAFSPMRMLLALTAALATVHFAARAKRLPGLR